MPQLLYSSNPESSGATEAAVGQNYSLQSALAEDEDYEDEITPK
ncbi:MAG: hypothetical protein CM15mP22_7310 [Gammaproteobacteria bacterium]|nr:MAG: hypothetical protein CM15mP22_7310 [Gammaproteobacteria bacterium]